MKNDVSLKDDTKESDEMDIEADQAPAESPAMQALRKYKDILIKGTPARQSETFVGQDPGTPTPPSRANRTRPGTPFGTPVTPVKHSAKTPGTPSQMEDFLQEHLGLSASPKKVVETSGSRKRLRRL